MLECSCRGVLFLGWWWYSGSWLEKIPKQNVRGVSNSHKFIKREMEGVCVCVHAGTHIHKTQPETECMDVSSLREGTCICLLFVQAMAEAEEQFVTEDGVEETVAVTDAQVLQTLEIPKTLMQDDAAGDGSGVTQYVVVTQTNGSADQDVQTKEAEETVVLMHVEGEEATQIVTLEEEVVEETTETVPMVIDGDQQVINDSDGEDTGLLQPGEALTGGADDEGETRIINLEVDEEEEEDSGDKDVESAKGRSEDEKDQNKDEDDEEEDQDDTQKPSDDIMQLPAQAIQDQTLGADEDNDDLPESSQTASPSKRTIRSPEKLAAARIDSSARLWIR